MQILVLYYSKTDNTKKLAKERLPKVSARAGLRWSLKALMK